MNRLFDSCRTRRENLALLAAGALDGPERADAECHLAACPQCRNYFAGIQSVSIALTASAHAGAEIRPTAAAVARWASAIRSDQTKPTPRQTSSVANHLPWWREVIWPWRRAWTGLAGTWAILLVFHLMQHDVRPKAVVSSAPMIASIREQQKILNELLADRSAAPDIDRPKTFSPKPRTARAESIAA
jgi:hypothetical protein